MTERKAYDAMVGTYDVQLDNVKFENMALMDALEKASIENTNYKARVSKLIYFSSVNRARNEKFSKAAVEASKKIGKECNDMCMDINEIYSKVVNLTSDFKRLNHKVWSTTAPLNHEPFQY